MRVAYITAGAAGMYCGSCLHDNTLAAALLALGHEALLIPTYTPIRTDEPNVSQERIFFGGINVYLQQKLPLFRHTPWMLDRLLDAPRLLGWVSRFAVNTQADRLGDLTLSVLRGEHGHQRKEIAKLAEWLATEVRPEIVNLTNALISGMVPELKRRLGVPVVCTLQGDDVFLETLPEPHRSESLALIREHCQKIDGFIATSRYYADFMTGYFGIPREGIEVIYPGLNLAGHGKSFIPEPAAAAPRPLTIGYFARVSPEKGLHVLADAFRILHETPPEGTAGLATRLQTTPPRYRLRVSGWLGGHNRRYFEGIRDRLRQSGLDTHFEHVESPDHASKVRFLQSLDVLSVPTVYREPKGLYVLEALANGVPVVQPRHGSFPELIEATGGGLLVNPEDPADLARGLALALHDLPLRQELGRKGKEAVHARFHAQRMARETLDFYGKFL
jgi:glycosyltransferase involved in cell wall biosynthesis